MDLYIALIAFKVAHLSSCLNMVMALIILIIKYKVCYVQKAWCTSVPRFNRSLWLAYGYYAGGKLSTYSVIPSNFMVIFCDFCICINFYLSFPMHSLSKSFIYRLRVQLFSFFFDRYNLFTAVFI